MYPPYTEVRAVGCLGHDRLSLTALESHGLNLTVVCSTERVCVNARTGDLHIHVPVTYSRSALKGATTSS
jgi:hypothetical protein